MLTPILIPSRRNSVTQIRGGEMLLLQNFTTIFLFERLTNITAVDKIIYFFRLCKNINIFPIYNFFIYNFPFSLTTIIFPIYREIFLGLGPLELSENRWTLSNFLLNEHQCCHFSIFYANEIHKYFSIILERFIFKNSFQQSCLGISKEISILLFTSCMNQTDNINN